MTASAGLSGNLVRRQLLRKDAISHSAAGMMPGVAGQPLMIASSCRYRS